MEYMRIGIREKKVHQTEKEMVYPKMTRKIDRRKKRKEKQL